MLIGVEMRVDLENIAFVDRLLYASLLLCMEPGNSTVSWYELLKTNFASTDYLKIIYLNRLHDEGLIDFIGGTDVPGTDLIDIESNFQVSLMLTSDEKFLRRLFKSLRVPMDTDVSILLNQSLVGEVVLYVCQCLSNRVCELDTSFEPPETFELLVNAYPIHDCFALIDQAIDKLGSERLRMFYLSSGSECLLGVIAQTVANSYPLKQKGVGLLSNTLQSTTINLSRYTVPMVLSEHCFQEKLLQL